MHIIWKRPDGFENAQPSDFFKVSLSNGAQLWLHRNEKIWYPFQVQGGWEGEGETQRLNQLINLLGIPRGMWAQHIDRLADTPVGQETQAPLHREGFAQWLKALSVGMKGHTWELEVIRCAIEDVANLLSSPS